jgi:hypothetical protein
MYDSLSAIDAVHRRQGMKSIWNWQRDIPTAGKHQSTAISHGRNIPSCLLFAYTESLGGFRLYIVVSQISQRATLRWSFHHHHKKKNLYQIPTTTLLFTYSEQHQQCPLSTLRSTA